MASPGFVSGHLCSYKTGRFRRIVLQPGRHLPNQYVVYRKYLSGLRLPTFYAAIKQGALGALYCSRVAFYLIKYFQISLNIVLS